MRLAAALVVLAVASRLVTWDPIAHGNRARHVRVTLVGGVAAAAVALGARALIGPTSRAPLLWIAGVVLAADLAHYSRLLHPIARGAPVVTAGADLRDDTALRRTWDVETSGAGTARVTGGALTLESPPGASAFLASRVPSLPDAQRNWLLPVGLLERERTERLAWRAAVHRTGDFYVIAELRRLLIQSVPYGIHVTYPDERDQLRGHEIALSAAADGGPHDWLIERTATQVALSIDGRPVWSAAAREPITQARLGETKRDTAHAGSMRIEQVFFAIALDRS